MSLHATMADLLKHHLNNVECQFMSKGIRHCPLQKYFILKKKYIKSSSLLFTMKHGLQSEQDWYSENRIAGNWYKTGHISEEGHLFVTGRITEVIAVDETMVLPCYIEGVFARHPCVENVVAFAIPDVNLYEVPGVALTLKAGSEVTETELLQFFVNERNVIQQNSIFDSKCLPKQVMILGKFPKLNSGKIARRTVRDIALKKLLQ